MHLFLPFYINDFFVAEGSDCLDHHDRQANPSCLLDLGSNLHGGDLNCLDPISENSFKLGYLTGVISFVPCFV